MGYRLAYLVENKEIRVYVICIGRRDKIYKILPQRLSNEVAELKADSKNI